MLEVLYHHTKFGGDLISSAAGAEKNVEFRHAFCVTLVKSESILHFIAFMVLRTDYYHNDHVNHRISITWFLV